MMIQYLIDIAKLVCFVYVCVFPWIMSNRILPIYMLLIMGIVSFIAMYIDLALSVLLNVILMLWIVNNNACKMSQAKDQPRQVV